MLQAILKGWASSWRLKRPTELASQIFKGKQFRVLRPKAAFPRKAFCVAFGKSADVNALVLHGGSVNEMCVCD